MKNLIFIVLLFQSFQMFAQNYFGTIYTKDDKKPALFTTLHIPKTGYGTVTDVDGKFNFDIPEKYAHLNLMVSFIGYKNQTIAISDLKKGEENIIWLEVDRTNLQEIVLTEKRRQLKPLQVLKRAIKNIETNFSTDTTSFDGYYRETVSENGKFIKYADAVVEVNYGPYQKKKFNWRNYYNGFNNQSLSGLSSFWGDRFHRGHYPTSTLKSDKLRIVESRSSDNISENRIEANIEGGPLGLFAKDRVKFKWMFMKKSRFSAYDYSLLEVLDSSTNTYDYVVKFYPKRKEEKKRGKFISIVRAYNDIVAGEIQIDRKSFAIKQIKYWVPKPLKNHICGYKEMNLKHFDYYVQLDYVNFNNKYYLSHLIQKDEFVYVDTIKNTRTAYNTTQEMDLYNVSPKQKYNISWDDCFTNNDANQLFDYALEYDTTFWKNYVNKYPENKIPESIIADLETYKPLLQQFKGKSYRDPNVLPPVAKVKTEITEIHEQKMVDDYAWLKDTKAPKSNEDIMEYIHGENDYFKNYIKPLKKEQRLLYRDIKKYFKLNTTSRPNKVRNYFYFSKYFEDNNYPIYYRRKVGEEASKVILDVEKMALGKPYYNVRMGDISPNEDLMVFYENTTGGDKNTLRIKSLSTDKILEDSLLNIEQVVWLSDSTFLYSVLEPKTNRVYQLKHHKLFDNSVNDKVIYTENDITSSIGFGRVKSREMILISSGNSIENEIYFLKVDDEELKLNLFSPRQNGVQYSIELIQDQFYIFTNEDAINWKLLKTDTANFQKSNWKTVLEHKEDVILENYQVYKDYFVYQEKENLQSRITIRNRTTQKEHQLKTYGESFELSMLTNKKYDTDTLEYYYSSFIRPASTYKYHLGSKDQILIEKDTLAFPYRGRIKIKKIWATAKDGRKIPMTLVYDKYRYFKGSNFSKVWMTSYGSYGIGQNVGFNRGILPLISRGFLYVIAHIRGGDDLGQQWHNEGKLMNKKNTFTDFIDCTEHLIEEGYARKGKIAIQGGSAGGLLMGAVANMRPDLYKAVILDVPFVDVMNTMLDDKLPLTTGEYLEWGNPNEEKAFKYMKSYSPYDNVKAQKYPNMFFFTGINDSKVGYWEPAKMVAKLRKTKTDSNTILLHTNLNAGHSGGSNRFAYYEDLALKYAIIFELFRNDSNN